MKNVEQSLVSNKILNIIFPFNKLNSLNNDFERNKCDVNFKRDKRISTITVLITYHYSKIFHTFIRKLLASVHIFD